MDLDADRVIVAQTKVCATVRLCRGHRRLATAMMVPMLALGVVFGSVRSADRASAQAAPDPPPTTSSGSSPTETPVLSGGNGARHFFAMDGYVDSTSGCEDYGDNPNIKPGRDHTGTVIGNMWLESGELHTDAPANGVLHRDGSFHLDYPLVGPSPLRAIDGHIGPPNVGDGSAPITGTWTAPYPNGTSTCLTHWVITSGHVNLTEGGFGVPFHPTTKPTPTAGGPSTTRPRPSPKPTPTTRAKRAVDHRVCPSMITGGLFEPTQGVWQDDPSFTDRPGKELSRAGAMSYEAELPMVVGRPTVLVGVDRVAGETPVHQRDAITLSGTTTGTRPVSVEMAFNTHAVAGVLTDDAVRPKELDIGAPCRAEHRFTLSVDATSGVPRHKTFTFPFGMHYQIDAAINVTDPFARGTVDGSVSVTGTALEEPRLNVVVVPVRLGLKEPGDSPAVLSIDPAKVANAIRAHLGDMYPLAPGTVYASVNRHELDLRSEHLDSMSPSEAERVLENELASYVRGASALNGASRVVAVLSARDTQALPLRNHGAEAWATQLIVGRSEALDFVGVAHEIAHTVPFHPWSDEQMVRACGFDYHNQRHAQKLAHGIRLRDGAKQIRQQIDEPSLMSTGSGWMDQCTYTNLVNGLIVTL